MEGTREGTAKQVEATRKRGKAMGGLGRKRASALKSTGKAQLLGASLKGVGTGASGVAAAGSGGNA